MATNTRFKDFSTTDEPVRFKIDEDIFDAPSVLAVPVMQELAVAAEKLKSGEANAAIFEALVDVLALILTEDSAVRLRERVVSRTHPIGFQQLVDVLLWMLEVYGLRPTQPSSSSSDGAPSASSGTLSTAGVPSGV